MAVPEHSALPCLSGDAEAIQAARDAGLLPGMLHTIACLQSIGASHTIAGVQATAVAAQAAAEPIRRMSAQHLCATVRVLGQHAACLSALFCWDR
jgi:hypothetical protein